jgi:hypothetical protein
MQFVNIIPFRTQPIRSVAYAQYVLLYRCAPAESAGPSLSPKGPHSME